MNVRPQAVIPVAVMSEMFNRNAIGARESFGPRAHADGVEVIQLNCARQRRAAEPNSCDSTLGASHVHSLRGS